MKNTLTIILAIFCLSLQAQEQANPVDTTIVSVNPTPKTDSTIVIGGDTVTFNIGAIVIEPVIVDAQGNEAYSITWSAFGLTQDTTKGCNTYVVLHGKNNQQLAEFNQPIPASVVNVWLDNRVIADYILSQNPRFKRYFAVK